MIKNEEGIIDYIKSNIKTASRNVVKSIGDDCAVIKISSNKYFVITTDTSLMGPHFTKNYSPYEIGYKSLATNLSDIAAMGCIPKYIFMALTIPKLESKWIKSFYKGIKHLTEKHNVALIGGDTNRGPLSVSIQVIGENKKNILYKKNLSTMNLSVDSPADLKRSRKIERIVVKKYRSNFSIENLINAY